MHIAFVVNNFPPRAGGVEFHVAALARELARRGDQVDVITLGSEPGSRVDGAVTVKTLPEHLRIADTLGFPALGTRRRLSRFLRTRSIDVVSVHTRFFPMSFIGVRAARLAGIPVIHTEHGSDHVVSDSTIVRVASRLVDRSLGRWVLRRADQVVGVSDSVTAFVRRLAGVDAEVFYNAIDAPEALASETPAQDLYRTLFVGRLVPGKGCDAYVDAIAALRGSGIPISGDIIGDGPEMTRLREHIDELNLADVVTVHGRLPQRAVRALMRGATLVNPTELAEGFQTTLLEATAEGGRVVTYDVPGAALLRSQGAPIVITASASTSALIEALRVAVGAPWFPMSKHASAAWMWPARADEYAEICRRLIHGRRTPRR